MVNINIFEIRSCFLRHLKHCCMQFAQLRCYKIQHNNTTANLWHIPRSGLDYGNPTLAGSSSVLNAAALSIFSKQRFESVTPLLRDLHRLHWLRVPQRVKHKLSVLVYRCLHNLAPEYLCNELRRVADISSRQRLRSSSTSALIVLPTRLSTVSDRAFPTAASRIWNSLPLHVTSAPSIQTFKKRLKPF